MSSMIEDVTPETRLLLREYAHRINNEFASAISIISVAALQASTDEAKCALTAVKERLFDFAQVHHALEMPISNVRIDAADYVHDLCEAISRSKLASQGIELVLKQERFRMRSERCWRLGLIISELVNNSARHAFAGQKGIIRVDLLPSASFVECRVADNGRSEPTAHPGRGLKIVTALARSLGGTFDQHFGPCGATSTLIVPLTEHRLNGHSQHKVACVDAGVDQHQQNGATP
jgi:two-component sensor histidine kinase